MFLNGQRPPDSEEPLFSIIGVESYPAAYFVVDRTVSTEHNSTAQENAYYPSEVSSPAVVETTRTRRELPHIEQLLNINRTEQGEEDQEDGRWQGEG